MGKSLVVVESPAKAKTIEKYLGKNFKVKASVGHIKDLPKSKIGVDIENDFQPTYQVIEAKKKVIDELRKIAEGAEAIYIATDPDREGEAIAWHVADEILPKAGKSKGKKKAEPATAKPIHRVLFNEITKKSVTDAIQHPIELRRNLFDAQQARRVLDRLVGYQVSPLLWDKVRRGLSAGRVQTVALRIICERERAIKAFVSEEYWSLDAIMEGSLPPSFEAHLTHFQGKKIKISNADESKRILESLRPSAHTLTKVTKKERRRHPYPPFITSKLQQEASHKLGFSASKTMTLAQKLYEGIELGEEGLVGLITYMRTDSVRVSNDAIAEARDLISQNWGKDFLPTSPNAFKTKKSAQDAHEAIRPTSALRTPESVKPFLEYDSFRLYELIWKRFIASQMTSAVYDQTSFEIVARTEAGDYGYRASGSLMKFSGFLKVYEAPVEEDLKAKKKDSDGDEEDESAGQMPDLQEGDILKVKEWKPEQHFTEPPPRFSDASLIKELEENGIGRPSTYAAILSNLVDKEYVQKDQRVYKPTDLGFIVCDVLIESFPNIFNVEFTAQMENELDDVEEGQKTYEKTLKDFYTPFSETLEKAKTQMRNIKRQEIPTDIACEKCGSTTIIKWGKRGEFLACTKYPECKFTSEFTKDETGRITLVKMESTGEKCDKCGSDMIIKTGRFGKFLACSKYPECKSTKTITTGVTCPECSTGMLVERRAKTGRNFYGCNKYPECKFATWEKPLKENCPLCQSPTLLVKISKAGSKIRCPKEACGYQRDESEAPTTFNPSENASH